MERPWDDIDTRADGEWAISAQVVVTWVDLGLMHGGLVNRPILQPFHGLIP